MLVAIIIWKWKFRLWWPRFSQSSVKRFKPINESIYPVPHVGWNRIKINNSLKGRSQYNMIVMTVYVLWSCSYYVSQLINHYPFNNKLRWYKLLSSMCNNILQHSFIKKSGKRYQYLQSIKTMEKNYNENLYNLPQKLFL